MKPTTDDKALIVSTVVLGLIAGAGAVALSLFLDVAEQLFLGFQENAAHPFAWQATPTRRLLSLIIGGLLAAGIWYLMRKRMKPTVAIAEALKDKPMPMGTTIVHVLTQILYVGTGGSVGRELAPRELAAMFAQHWSDWLSKHAHWQLSKDDQKLLIAAAAGAGFAGVYIAPITGTMFCVEVLLKRVTKRAVATSLAMSAIATLVGSLLKGFHPYYLVGAQSFSLRVLPLAVVLGLICGACGAWFHRAFRWALDHQSRDAHLLWQLPLAALATGLIAFNHPQIMGNGRALAQTALNTHLAALLPTLLALACLKALVTVFTLRAGASGGTLTPSIAIGATIGLTMGLALQSLGLSVPLWQAGIVGAASFLAMSQQAPFMAMFMLFEVSHLDYSALLPLAVGISIAMLTGRYCLPRTPQTK